jgi:hypothetical protein
MTNWDPGLKRGFHYTQLLKPYVAPSWNKASAWERFKMKLFTRNAVIKTSEGIKIVSIPRSAKHSLEIGSAPPHWNPGDEKFITHKSGRLIFDHVSHSDFHKQKKIEKTVVEVWNESSPIERLKSKIKGGPK